MRTGHAKRPDGDRNIGAGLRKHVSTAIQRRASPQPAPAPPAAPDFPNPTLLLDASLGIVVIEFRNNTGLVTTSIPSDQQLAAYHQHGVPAENTDSTAATTTPLAAGNATSPPVATTPSNPPAAANTPSPGSAAAATGDAATSADHSFTV